MTLFLIFFMTRQFQFKKQIAKKQANLWAWPLTAFVDRFIIATSKYEEAVIVPKPKSFQNMDRS